MKYLKYLWYLIRHKWYVMLYCFKFNLYWEGIVHDLDKFMPKRFIIYARYAWKNGEKNALPEGLTMKIKDSELSREWFKHRTQNKHHWQYFVVKRLLREEGLGGLWNPDPMDSKSILEMYCDWMGAMRCKGQGYKELKVWYADTRESRRLNERTLEIVDKLMQYKNEEGRTKGNNIR